MSGAFVIFIPLPLTPSSSHLLPFVVQHDLAQIIKHYLARRPGSGLSPRHLTRQRKTGRLAHCHFAVALAAPFPFLNGERRHDGQTFRIWIFMFCHALSSCDQSSGRTVRREGKGRKTNRLAKRGLRSLTLLPRFRRDGNRLFLRNRRLVRLPALAYRFVSTSADVISFLYECPGSCRSTDSRARLCGKKVKASPRGASL